MMLEPQTSVFFLGVRIDEPVAMVTDLMIAAVCFYAYSKLSSRNLSGQSQRYFKYYFLLMGVATFLGGVIGHGFLYALSFHWKLPGWITSMFSVALIERSSIAHARSLIKPAIGKFFLILNIIELLTIMAITMTTLDFKWVEFHSAYGLLVIVTSFHFYTWWRTKEAGSLIILAAIAVTGCGSLVFTFQISPHKWFNYIDLSHVFLALGAYIFYVGALNLQKRNGVPKLEPQFA